MNRRARAGKERGSVAVEFALVVPLFLVLVTGGVHFADVLLTGHRLGEAVGLGARTAAVQNASSATIRNLVRDRLGSASSRCPNLSVNVSRRSSGGVRFVEVDARCNYAPIFGAFGGLGPSTIREVAAMPVAF